MKIKQKRFSACIALMLCILFCLSSLAVFAEDGAALDTEYADIEAGTTDQPDNVPSGDKEEPAIHLPDADENVTGDNYPNSSKRNSEAEDDSFSGINLLSTTHDISNGPLHVLVSDGDITVTGTYSSVGSSGHAIEIDAGYSGTITLDNVSIDVSSYNTNAAFLINGSGNVNSVDTYVNVELVGTNRLISGYTRAGLEVWSGAQVDIGGSGTLYADCNNTGYNSSGAGIGAGNISGSGGNVIIRSGNIYATAGYHGAGIGGAWSGAGAYNGTIIIYGGNVVSNGGTHGAGIGGGCANAYLGRSNTGTILVLPPANVSASSDGIYETVGEMNTTVYIGDPRSPVTTVRTSEYTAGADIYMNLINVTDAVAALLRCNISTSVVDLTHIKLGTTDSSGIASINMEIGDSVNFYTDALAASGLNFQSYETTVSESKEIVLKAPVLDLTANNLTSSVPALKSGYTTVPNENFQTIELTNSGDMTITNITLAIEAPYDSLFEIVSIDKTTLSAGEKATVVLRPLTGLSRGTHHAKLRVLGKKPDGTGGASVQLTMEKYVNLTAQSVSQPVKFDAGNKGSITSGDNEYWFVAGNAITKVPTVKANSGYAFKGWSLDGSTTVDPATITVDADTDYVFVALYTTIAQTGTSSPKTGESLGISIFIITLILSLLVIVSLLFYRRRYIMQK